MTDKLLINLFAELCSAYGMHKVVISPGSRNAPLIVAFHHQPEIECYVIPDERSAAYFAIGLAQYWQQPVGIVCTSGTAALNYTPAMAEAYYQKLPLVAITADRPPEWIDQLDGQTINQTGIYDNFISYQANLPVEAFSKNEIWQVERIVRDGFFHLKLKNRPIHFNVPIREPLYNKTGQSSLPIKPAAFDDSGFGTLDEEKLIRELIKYQKILLILGMKLPDPAFSDSIDHIATGKNIVVFSETLSNIRSKDVFQTQDALINSFHDKNSEKLKPELVISFGCIVLSKSLKQWIRSMDHVEQWLVTQDDDAADTFQGIEKIIHIDPESFLHCLLKIPGLKTTDYYDAWKNAYEKFTEIHSAYIDAIPWCDMLVFKIISMEIPDDSCVHLGNSSSVRYAQFFKWNNGIMFFGNRGTAGIDGCTSTALGMASQTDKPVILITGDVSFLYDSNALWNNYKKPNFKIIVINNKGGNIFRIISGINDAELLNKYFVTQIPVSIEYLCLAYGIEYYKAKNEQELYSILGQFFDDECCALLEIQTNPSDNTLIWKEYYRTAKNDFHNE